MPTPTNAINIGDNLDTLTINTSNFDVSSGQITNATDETINGIDINAGAVSDVVDLDVVLTDGLTATIDGDGTPTADILAVGVSETSSTDGVDALQLTFGVSDASGNIIDITPSYSDATAGGTSKTYNIIDVDSFTASQNAAGDTGLIRGVNIGNLTQTESAGTITASALRVGTGWDDVLNYNGTTVINGSGQVVTTQLTGTLFTAAGDSGSGTVAQGNTLTIIGGTNITTVGAAGPQVTVNLDDSITLAGTLAVNGDQITSDGNLTINANGIVDIQDAVYADSLDTGGAEALEFR